MKRRKRRRVILLSAAVLAVGFLLWALWGNTALELHELSVKDSRLPQPFSGFRIAQLSDLHSAEFGHGNQELLRLLEEAQPDLVVMTGDLIDSRTTDTELVLDFAARAARLAPTYYVTGNHESRVPGEFLKLEQGMRASGIQVLRGETAWIRRGGEAIQLIGIDDPAFLGDSGYGGDASAAVLEELKRLAAKDAYTVLLSHRPELAAVYEEAGIDLAFCGHAHGGQIRLPFLGGVYAPGQGFFPAYDGGFYTVGDTGMVVSRGLGNSVAPLRVNNRPELVVAELGR